MDGRLNEARIRNQFYPLYKNTDRNQNLLETLFRDKSKFDRRNPILADFLQQVSKITMEDMLKDAPNLDSRTSDADTQKSLDKFAR